MQGVRHVPACSSQLISRADNSALQQSKAAVNFSNKAVAINGFIESAGSPAESRTAGAS
jgi:hypothetical protein